MDFSAEQIDFIKDMGIGQEKFIALKRDIKVLIEIAKDYESHKSELLDEAEYIANKLQRCKSVHSVRFRIKDTSHLIEKIIRKWGMDVVAEKYNEISYQNYKTVITDLIGVRAIYLFKEDWSIVHDHIISRWEVKEPVTIYFREGDDLSLYEESDCVKAKHFSGYRSVHYLIPATKIKNENIYCEIQTRTIFEEGWSEIDHKVRYPSFLEDKHLQRYLNIFNRLAGSADEMGSFVKNLVDLIGYNAVVEQRRISIAAAYDEKILKLEKTVEELISKEAESKEIKKAYLELRKLNNKRVKEAENQEKELATLRKNKHAALVGVGLDPRHNLATQAEREKSLIMQHAMQFAMQQDNLNSVAENELRKRRLMHEMAFARNVYSDDD